MVYPAVSLGARADLQADIQADITADKDGREQFAERAKKEGLRMPYFRNGNSLNEESRVSYQSMAVLKACLLLRAGETALAEAYWDQLLLDLKDDGGDPYLVMAWQWSWNVWDRAVCAHMRGDDVVSLTCANLLAAALPQMDKTAADRRIKHPLGNNGEAAPYFGDIYDALPALRADEQHRVDSADAPPSLDEAVKLSEK